MRSVTNLVRTYAPELSDRALAALLFPVANRAVRQAQPRTSNFCVGAAAITTGPRVIWGWNNETLPPHADSTHAEENLTGRLLGSIGEKVTDVVIVGQNGALLTPCGNCREVLLANATEDARFLMVEGDGQRRWMLIRDTLPNPAYFQTNIRLPENGRPRHYLQSLFSEALRVLRDRAYTPYYPQVEATAILCADETIVAATPRQDASYQHERSVAGALAQIDATRSRVIEAVLFMSGNSSSTGPTYPDGRSRQMLFEASQVAGVDFEVAAASPTGELWLTTISKLLPHAFGPAELGKNVGLYC